MKVLNDSNFLLYAAANYTNPSVYDTVEFYEDLNRFKYVKKLFYRYHERGELRERLILNHLITLYNIFEPSANTRMLFYRIDEEHWTSLKTFLLFLNFMPDVVYHIGEEGKNILSSDISIDLNIATTLRKI